MNHSLSGSEQIRVYFKNNGGNIPPLLVNFMNCIITIKNEYWWVEFNHKIAPLVITTKDYQHVQS